MTKSLLLSSLSTNPQTAKQIAVKLGHTDLTDGAKRIGCQLYHLCNKGLVERDENSRKRGWYVPRKVDSSRYEDIQC